MQFMWPPNFRISQERWLFVSKMWENWRYRPSDTIRRVSRRECQSHLTVIAFYLSRGHTNGIEWRQSPPAMADGRQATDRKRKKSVHPQCVCDLQIAFLYLWQIFLSFYFPYRYSVGDKCPFVLRSAKSLWPKAVTTNFSSNLSAYMMAGFCRCRGAIVQPQASG